MQHFTCFALLLWRTSNPELIWNSPNTPAMKMRRPVRFALDLASHFSEQTSAPLTLAASQFPYKPPVADPSYVSSYPRGVTVPIHTSRCWPELLRALLTLAESQGPLPPVGILNVRYKCCSRCSPVMENVSAARDGSCGRMENGTASPYGSTDGTSYRPLLVELATPCQSF